MNAYSEDLRKKIVETVSDRGMGKSEAAHTFSVSLSSVQRYVRMASKGEALAPKKRPGLKPKLDEKARRLLAANLKERPFVTHSHRREYLKATAGVWVTYRGATSFLMNEWCRWDRGSGGPCDAI